MQGATRYFVVNTGRSGSTLLSVILADAGAAFGLPIPRSWDPGGGEMEHPLGLRATAAFRRAFRAGSTKPEGWLRRRAWQLHRSSGRRALRKLLAQAEIVKCEDLDLVVASVLKLGFFPKVVLCYRRFEDYAVSRGLLKSSANVDALLAQYCRTYRNGWLLLQTFGGCAVGFDELTDLTATSWAGALARVTGFDAESLLVARARRLGKVSRPVARATFDEAANQLFSLLAASRGQEIPASDQAIRNWQARQRRERAAAHAPSPLNVFPLSNHDTGD